jgi:hypothetical protein
MMEAERTYSIRGVPSRADSDADYERQLAYTSECMRSHDFGLDYSLPGCGGRAIPSPQINEQCYRFDWRAKLGLPRAN